MTPRDLWLLEMLHEHRVLTSHHITALWHTAHRVTNRRLRQLHQLHVLDSFRPLTPRGSAPEHYTLGRRGAALLAARWATDVKHLSWRPDSTARTAFSPTLEHDLATTTLLTSLAATHHHDPHRQLTLWLSARSAARLWGDHARPDAYAHWQHDTTVLPFFLEHDTGSETLRRVEAKLAGYAALPTTTPVLIHTPSPAREAHLHQRLAPTARHENLPVATAHHPHAWLPLNPPSRDRLTLDQLAHHWPHLTPALTPEQAEHLPAEGRPQWRPVPPLPLTVR
ncbi:replication-relaxation family protein [Streptomyces sp. DSM 44915]|uniref:Replication-relaxation family protein n=1 Tax=Streptomyces chisholmiae TaxID=3075540 RepID=A0ABU2JQF9_9ACTN|nr:replication-relaxation family protein [Streptomyces sp. DSM 44915]MDT0267225.1 replication-relaxation family protein [Streptomyces sp. DSM 44915]